MKTKLDNMVRHVTSGVTQHMNCSSAPKWPSLGFALLARTWVLSLWLLLFPPLLGALFNGVCQGFSINKYSRLTLCIDYLAWPKIQWTKSSLSLKLCSWLLWLFGFSPEGLGVGDWKRLLVAAVRFQTSHLLELLNVCSHGSVGWRRIAFRRLWLLPQGVCVTRDRCTVTGRLLRKQTYDFVMFSQPVIMIQNQTMYYCTFVGRWLPQKKLY